MSMLEDKSMDQVYPSPMILSKRFQFDGLPAFRLNAIRREYRSRFMNAIKTGKIQLRNVKACPVCGAADDLSCLSEKDRFGLPFSAILCRGCSVVFTSPQISGESLGEYYRSYYHPLVLGTRPGRFLHHLVNVDQGKKIHDFIQNSLPEKNHYEICEVGCASGTNLVELRDCLKAKGKDVSLTGSEFELSHAEEARKRGIDVISGDVIDLVANGKTYDIIILSHIVEHFPTLDDKMAQLRSLLKPEGLMYIEVPGIFSINRYQNDFASYLVHAHMFHFTLKSLEAACAKHGFVLVQGDETVRASFQVQAVGPVASPSGLSNANDIVRFLKGADLLRPKRAFLKKLVFAIQSLYYGLRQLNPRTRVERF